MQGRTPWEGNADRELITPQQQAQGGQIPDRYAAQARPRPPLNGQHPAAPSEPAYGNRPVARHPAPDSMTRHNPLVANRPGVSQQRPPTARTEHTNDIQRMNIPQGVRPTQPITNPQMYSARQTVPQEQERYPPQPVVQRGRVQPTEPPRRSHHNPPNHSPHLTRLPDRDPSPEPVSPYSTKHLQTCPNLLV